MKQYFTLLTTFVCCLSLSAQVYINPAATGANTGQNWQDAVTDLQTALDVAEPGDELWLVGGTYLPENTNEENKHFATSKAISLYGGFAGTERLLEQREPSVNVTVLSGDYLGNDEVTINVEGDLIYTNYADNAENILKLTSLTGASVLDGLTIRGGGGGIGSALQVATLDTASVLIRNCTIEENFSRREAGAMTLRAGADALLNFTMEFSTLRKNRGADKGGALWLLGDGFTEANYQNTVFSFNQASGRGGVLEHDLRGRARYEGCLFANNRSASGGAVFQNSTMGADFINCTFRFNQSTKFTQEASVIYNFNDFGTDTIGLYNCLFADNGDNPLQARGQAGYHIAHTLLEVEGFNDFSFRAGKVVDGGNNLFNESPLFDGPESFVPGSESTLINAGQDSFVTLALDLLRTPRIANDTVDIGAYELPSVTATERPLDILALNVFPNPAADQIDIEVGENYPEASIRLLDLNGRTLQSFPRANGPVATLYVGQYPAGTYVIEVIHSGRRYLQRLVKQ